MNRYIFFSICWGIFFAVLWKFARREGDNTSEHRMDGRHKSDEKMDYSSWLMISQRLFCWFSLNLRFSSSICVSENKDVQITHWKKCRVFLITWLLSILDFWHSNLMKPNLTGGNSLGRWETATQGICLYFLATANCIFTFSLCVNYTAKEQDIERNGLWKPLNV